MKTTGGSNIPKFGVLDFLGHPNDDDDLEDNGWVDDMLLHQVQARDPMPLAAPATKTDKIYSVGCFHSFTFRVVNSRRSSDSIILFSLSR